MWPRRCYQLQWKWYWSSLTFSLQAGISTIRENWNLQYRFHLLQQMITVIIVQCISLRTFHFLLYCISHLNMFLTVSYLIYHCISFCKSDSDFLSAARALSPVIWWTGKLTPPDVFMMVMMVMMTIMLTMMMMVIVVMMTMMVVMVMDTR